MSQSHEYREKILTQSACRTTAPFFLCSLLKMSSGNSWMAARRTDVMINMFPDKTYISFPQVNDVYNPACDLQQGLRGISG